MRWKKHKEVLKFVAFTIHQQPFRLLVNSLGYLSTLLYLYTAPSRVQIAIARSLLSLFRFIKQIDYLANNASYGYGSATGVLEEGAQEARQKIARWEGFEWKSSRGERMGERKGRGQRQERALSS